MMTFLLKHRRFHKPIRLQRGGEVCSGHPHTRWLVRHAKHPRRSASAAPPPETPSTEPRDRIRRTVDSAGICVLTFDCPGASANLFDRAMLLELRSHLHELALNPDLKGVILASAKPSIFIAGADLKAFQNLTRSANPADAGREVGELVQLGQDVFSQLNEMPVPTIAAIHGACLGGGFELALACTRRIASDDRVTKIGLPETRLGILPAWGGCTRLPRLIGLSRALNVILQARVLASAQALRLGLVDQLVPRERLLERARSLLLDPAIAPVQRSRRAARFLRSITANALLVWLRSRIRRQTGGHYPAVLKALEVVTRGFGRTLEESLRLEREAFLQLLRTDACKNLVRIFFLQERAKKAEVRARWTEIQGQQPPAGSPIARVAVVGAGVMGAGIAQWLSSRGIQVRLKDVSAEQVGKGLSNIRRLYEMGIKRHVFSKQEARAGMDRIFPVPADDGNWLHHVDLVIEAAAEQLPLKKEIFRHPAEQCGPGTILATNTSALSVDELAASIDAPERVIGLHFFNPVHRMQLVEVVRGTRSSPDAVVRAVELMQRIGKLPVVVKDRPGFVVNRILMPGLVEAVRLLEAGAGIKDIDRAMIEFGMPMGPLRLIDEVGVDVAFHVAGTLHEKFGDRAEPSAILDRMMQSGWLGRKTKCGFYLHDSKSPKPNRALEQGAGQNPGRESGAARATKLSRQELQSRMVLLMVNEAARCLEEGAADTAEDIDFAMIMGAGWAPFRGGPLKYAETIGADRLVAAMKRLVESGEARFAPCDLLQQLAASGRPRNGNGGTS